MAYEARYCDSADGGGVGVRSLMCAVEFVKRGNSKEVRLALGEGVGGVVAVVGRVDEEGCGV